MQCHTFPTSCLLVTEDSVLLLQERLARGEDPPVIPYIKPFGER